MRHAHRGFSWAVGAPAVSIGCDGALIICLYSASQAQTLVH